MMRYIENYPDELDLIEFFNTEAYYRDDHEEKFAYIYTDSEGVSLDFGFSHMEGWLQIFVKHNDKDVITLSYEGFKEFSIKNYKGNKYIQANVEVGGISIALTIHVEPSIKVESIILDNRYDEE